MSSRKLSIVVISYNMNRELPRTLFTLRAPFQQSIHNEDIEIIVVDNGSSTPPPIEPTWDNVLFERFPAPTPSPAAAINFGIGKAQSDFIGVMIDGARMASPNMLSRALQARRLSERTVISTMAYHLGDDVQMKSVAKGYCQEKEDELLKSVPWEQDGYRLFEVSVLAGSSSRGWFLPMAESNALFMDKRLWNELGGYDERFACPGGGLVNLDTYERANNLEDSLLVNLLGEGTFHQVHGGIATSAPSADFWKLAHPEYMEIRGRSFRRPTRTPLLFGMVRPELRPYLQYSLEQI